MLDKFIGGLLTSLSLDCLPYETWSVACRPSIFDSCHTFSWVLFYCICTRTCTFPVYPWIDVHSHTNSYCFSSCLSLACLVSCVDKYTALTVLFDNGGKTRTHCNYYCLPLYTKHSLLASELIQKAKSKSFYCQLNATQFLLVKDSPKVHIKTIRVCVCMQCIVILCTVSLSHFWISTTKHIVFFFKHKWTKVTREHSKMREEHKNIDTQKSQYQNVNEER